MFEKFAQELKEAREKSEMTLQQLAAKSRIDLKFIEAMEKGDFSFLPEIYVKAFIRDYSKIVGVDENLFLKKYDAAKQGKDYDENRESQDSEEKKNLSETTSSAQSPSSVQQPAKKQIVDNETSKPVPSSTKDAGKKKIILGAVAGAVVIIFLVVYFAFMKSDSSIIVTEKPYEQVRKENQQRFIKEKPETNKKITSEPVDSLSLLMEASDTSWVKILLDNQKVEEFILFPNSKKDIKARSNYRMIIGNSGAINFKLNNKELKFKGQNKKVKYVSIDSSGLKYLNQPPNFGNN